MPPCPPGWAPTPSGVLGPPIESQVLPAAPDRDTPPSAPWPSTTAAYTSVPGPTAICTFWAWAVGGVGAEPREAGGRGEGGRAGRVGRDRPDGQRRLAVGQQRPGRGGGHPVGRHPHPAVRPPGVHDVRVRRVGGEGVDRPGDRL